VTVWLYDLLNGLKESSRCAGQPEWNVRTIAAATAVRRLL